MANFWRILNAGSVVFFALALAGCATTPTNERDPFEPMNREFFEFNMAIDEAILRPVARVYRDAVPPLAREGVSNFFGNLDDAYSFANNVLQLKPTNAGQDLIRVTFNTAFGFGGLIDITGQLGIEKQNQDFGLTLARYGVPSGPYLVLPLLGPSTVRDSTNYVALLYAAPVFYVSNSWKVQTGLTYLSVVDMRAQLLDTEEALEGAILDRYQQIRDLYLQRRAYLAGEDVGYDIDDYYDPDEDDFFEYNPTPDVSASLDAPGSEAPVRIEEEPSILREVEPSEQ